MSIGGHNCPGPGRGSTEAACPRLRLADAVVEQEEKQETQRDRRGRRAYKDVFTSHCERRTMRLDEKIARPQCPRCSQDQTTMQSSRTCSGLSICAGCGGGCANLETKSNTFGLPSKRNFFVTRRRDEFLNRKFLMTLLLYYCWSK